MSFDDNDDCATFQAGISGFDGEENDYIVQEYHALAFQALLAAETLNSNYSNPIFILLCHALELALKSYLSSKGVESEELRKNYGHDIEKLLKCSIEHGLLLKDDTLDLIEIYFYDFDEDKLNRVYFSSLTSEQKQNLKAKHGHYISQIIEECRMAKSDIPYGIQFFLAYVYDDDKARSEIDHKRYKGERRKIGRFTNIRYSMENTFPPRNSSQCAIREVIKATDPNISKNML